MGATPGFNKIRKAELEKAGRIRTASRSKLGNGCGHCRYHRGENAVAGPRPDRYKNHRRAS